MQIILHEKEQVKDALLLVGFPSRGLVGGVAANFVIDDLNMRHIGALYDARLPPTVAVRNGVAHAPIRLFASDTKCGPDGSCDKLVVVLSDIPLEPNLLNDVARTIVQWAKTQGIGATVVLEGIKGNDALHNRNGTNGKKLPRIRGVRSLQSKHRFDEQQIEIVHDAMLSSYASAFFLAANELDVDVVGFFIESRTDVQDAQAAVNLLQHVDPLLPNINFDTRQMKRRASTLETQMKGTIKSSARELQAIRKPNEMMYA